MIGSVVYVSFCSFFIRQSAEPSKKDILRWWLCGKTLASNTSGLGSISSWHTRSAAIPRRNKDLVTVAVIKRCELVLLTL